MDGEKLTFARRLPQNTKNLFVAGMAEFVGTFLFLFFALGGTTAVNTAGPADEVLAGNPSQLLYICLCFGFSLAVTVWMFYRVSGGLFNPVVTLSLVLVGAVGPVRGVVVFVAQLLGGICAAAVLSALLPGPLLASTTLRNDTSIVRGLFIEMFATSILVLAILLMAVEKHRATFMAPLCIGLALFIAELTSIPYTGGSVNPARSLGPCVAMHSFPHYEWIYWVGPGLGALLATAFYKIIKFLEYETCNPGQDFDSLALAASGAGAASPCCSHGAVFDLHHSASVLPHSAAVAGATAGASAGIASKQRPAGAFEHKHSASTASAQTRVGSSAHPATGTGDKLSNEPRTPDAEAFRQASSLEANTPVASPL